MLNLRDAQNLVNGQRVQVSKTKEIWTVTGVTNKDDKSVYVNVKNDAGTDSYFDQTRLHLFEMAEPSGVIALGGSHEDVNEKALAAFRQTVQDASEEVFIDAPEVVSLPPIEIPEERIEDNFLAEPELTKPKAKKSTKKK